MHSYQYAGFGERGTYARSYTYIVVIGLLRLLLRKKDKETKALRSRLICGGESTHFKFLGPAVNTACICIYIHTYIHLGGRVMPHRVPTLLFIALLLFLNFVAASPALFGRDGPGAGDSLWELELNDVFGAAAAGLDGLYKLWDTTIPPEVPSEQSPDERQYQPQPPETPGPMAFPLFNPTAMKTCAEAGESKGNQLDRFEIEQSWWQVEQDPETGYVAASPPPL